MKSIELQPVNDSYDAESAKKAVSEAIENFYSSLLKSIDEIGIDDIIKNKNPYLYRAKSMNTAQEIVQSALDAHISSSEETKFGNLFFEPLAIAVSNGRKSTSEGVDLEIDENGFRYIIAVKSGTSVFNADSKKRQNENFKRCATLAKQGGLVPYPVIGFAYGSKKRVFSGDTLELAGQDFWEFLTGDPDFYEKIVSYMEEKPEVYAQRFEESRTLAVNRLTKDFSARFVREDGFIDWNAILELNSGSVVRRENAEFEDIKNSIIAAIENNPTITKKKLAKDVRCSDKKLKKALDELLGDGRLESGYGGKSRGWTIVPSGHADMG